MIKHGRKQIENNELEKHCLPHFPTFPPSIIPIFLVSQITNFNPNISLHDFLLSNSLIGVKFS